MFSLLLLTTPSWTSLQTIFLFFLTLQSSQPSASTSTSYLGEMLSNLPISLCDDLTIKISPLAYLLPSNLHKNMCAWHFQNAYKSFCLIWLKLPAYFVISYLYSFSLLPVTVNHHFLLHFHKSFCPFISFLLTHSMLPLKFLLCPEVVLFGFQLSLSWPSLCHPLLFSTDILLRQVNPDSLLTEFILPPTSLEVPVTHKTKLKLFHGPS